MDRGLRGQIARYARALHERGWVANHDGNVTARAEPGRYLATPTATSKIDIDERRLIEIDGKGQPTGSGGVFGEIGLHLAVYDTRPDVQAVVHAHPPYATALSCTGSRLLEQPFIAEAVVSIGPSIPTVPFAAPGKPAAEAVARFAIDHDAVLLESHGALAWGGTVEQAYLRLELVEHLARIATLAEATGGIRPLPDAAVRSLLEARVKARLGAAADRALDLWQGDAAGPRPAGAVRPVVACAPAPHSSTPTIAPDRPSGSDVATLVREEILRALRER